MPRITLKLATNTLNDSGSTGGMWGRGIIKRVMTVRALLQVVHH